MVFHPSHRPLEIATRFPQFHSPDDDDISPTNKKHKGTLLSSYRGGHFYWALTFFSFEEYIVVAQSKCPLLRPIEWTGPLRRGQENRDGLQLTEKA